MLSYARAWIEVSISAFQHNLHVLSRLASPASILAVIKANAYGHGLVTAAQALKDAQGFGVACLSEALQLRQAGILNKIVLLEGVFYEEEYIQATEYEIDIVIHHTQQLEWFLKNPPKRPMTIWLKVNIGMNRLGFPVDQVVAVYEKICTCSGVRCLIVMSHFSSANQLESNVTKDQLSMFNALKVCLDRGSLPVQYSLANSASLLAMPDSHYHWVRPGLALYGVSPFKDYSHSYALRPVMTIKSKIIAIQSLNSGDSVGYDGKFRCDQSMRIGIVGFGYGDGYPYHAPCGTFVLLNGQTVPLVGQVSMDMLAIDLSTQPHAKLGDVVVLWGEGLPIERIAAQTNRTTYELLCSMQRGSSQRLEVYIVE